MLREPRKAVFAEVRIYEEDGKVRIPGVARCIVGTKGHTVMRRAPSCIAVAHRGD
jgi:hypothetical protein